MLMLSNTVDSSWRPSEETRAVEVPLASRGEEVATSVELSNMEAARRSARDVLMAGLALGNRSGCCADSRRNGCRNFKGVGEPCLLLLLKDSRLTDLLL